MNNNLMPDLDELEAIGFDFDDGTTTNLRFNKQDSGDNMGTIVLDNQGNSPDDAGYVDDWHSGGIAITEKTYYYDALGNVCDKENAFQYCVVKHDNYGKELSQKWNKIDDSFHNNDFSNKIRTVTSDFGEKVKDNDFVKSVKNDIKKSDTIKAIKNKIDKVSDTDVAAKVSLQKGNKKIKIVAIVLVVVIVLVAIAGNIHKCDECEEIFFGKGHQITYWGETERICNDCYGFD